MLVWLDHFTQLCFTSAIFRSLTRKKIVEVGMGGKVSTKMAAAGRVIQAVRPHAPLIKFPNRQDVPKPNVQEALKILAVTILQSPSSLHPSSTPAPLSRPHGPVTLLTGKPDTLANVQELPQRYRRRPVTVEEMDYIQRGGPE